MDNGWSRAKTILAVIGSALVIATTLALGVYAWADVRYCTSDNTRRIERIEQTLEDQNTKLDLILEEVRKR